MSRPSVMAPSIQVFVQVALLFCVVTTSMGGITDCGIEFSQLENKLNVQEEEIKSLHQMIKLMEKRLEQLEAKEFVEVQIQPAVPTLHACQSGLSSYLISSTYILLYSILLCLKKTIYDEI